MNEAKSSVNFTIDTNYYSNSTSEGDKIDKSLSARKKPFARKPASFHSSNKGDKKRVQKEEPSRSEVNETKQAIIDPFLMQTPIKINFVKRKERQTQFYIKEREMDNSMNIKKDISFSPFYTTNKKTQPETTSYFAKKPLNKQYQIARPSQNFNFVYVSTPSSARVPQKEEIKQQSKSMIFNSQNKSESNLLQSHVNYPIHPKNTRLNVVSKNNLRNQKPKQQVSQFECTYCKNNKEMTDIMCEKYSKLEEQLRVKNEKIKELTLKLQNLSKQHSTLIEKYEHKLEASQLKQIQFFREKEDLTNRIEHYMSEISKLNQKIKYADIQNSILLRFKDQYQLMTKEYDLITYQNQRLQKSINQIRKNDKQDPTRKTSFEKGFNHKQGTHQGNGRGVVGQHIYIQDDLVSLSLSERSMQHI